MSTDHDFTMPLDLLDAVEEPTMRIVLVDSLGVAEAPGTSQRAASLATRVAEPDAVAGGGRVQHAVILAANNGAAFITGGRLIRTTPPSPPPRRTARGTGANMPLAASRPAASGTR